MKKLTTLFAFVMLFAMAAFAQKAPVPQLTAKNASAKTELSTQAFDLGTTEKSFKAPAKAPEEGYALVTLPDGVTATQWYVESATMYVGQSTSTSYNDIYVAFDGNDVYIQGLAYYFPSAWIKGTLANGVVTFPITYMGIIQNIDMYLCGYGTGTPTTFSFTYDATNNTLTADDYILLNKNTTSLGFYSYYVSLVLTADEPEPDVVVTPPDGLVTEEWNFTAQDLNVSNGAVYTDYSAPVQMGFDGDDVYIAGFCPYDAEAWVKGTRNGNTITLDNDQYFGAIYGSYDMYFVGYQNGYYDEDGGTFRGDGFGAVTFTMNDEGNQLTTNDLIIISAAKSKIQYYAIYTDGVITKVLEQPGTPADPDPQRFVNGSYGHYFVFSVPTVDTDGNAMLTSKLYYQIYKDIEGQTSAFTLSADLYEELDEDMSIIPYSFTDEWDIYPGDPIQVYIYSDDLDSWNKIGVKSIYEGGGESHESNIVWLDIKPYAPTAITLNVTDADEVAILPNATFQLSVVSVLPEGASTAVTWTSSDEHIATVSEDGLVTGMEFDGYAIRNGINQAPSDNDHYDYFPVVITATADEAGTQPTPASTSVTVWVKSSTRTAINDVKANNVESVKYVNAQGQVSNTPFDGVNIEVPRMSDGTTKTVKVVK